MTEEERAEYDPPAKQVMQPIMMDTAMMEIIFVRANWERDDNGKFIQERTTSNKCSPLHQPDSKPSFLE
jgi:hypothetical protein